VFHIHWIRWTQSHTVQSLTCLYCPSCLNDLFLISLWSIWLTIAFFRIGSQRTEDFILRRPPCSEYCRTSCNGFGLRWSGDVDVAGPVGCIWQRRPCTECLRVRSLDQSFSSCTPLMFCNWWSPTSCSRMLMLMIRKSTAFASHRTSTHCRSVRVSVCIDEVISWMMANRLQLNPAKTEVLWCSSARRQHQIPTGRVRVTQMCCRYPLSVTSGSMLTLTSPWARTSLQPSGLVLQPCGRFEACGVHWRRTPCWHWSGHWS